MLHMFKMVIAPEITLAQVLRGWRNIAWGLSEPPRKRRYQVEKLKSWAFLS